MEHKGVLFFITGILLCVIEVLVLIIGYGIYQKQEFALNGLALLLFIKFFPKLPVDQWYFFYILPFLDVYISSLWDFIQNILHPISISIFLQLIGIVCATLGGILIVIAVITYRH